MTDIADLKARLHALLDGGWSDVTRSGDPFSAATMAYLAMRDALATIEALEAERAELAEVVLRLPARYREEFLSARARIEALRRQPVHYPFPSASYQQHRDEAWDAALDAALAALETP